MTMKPDWLPAMFSVNPWTEKTYDLLYAVFKADFKDSQPQFRGRIVWIFPEKEDGKEKVFWHLTSRDDKEAGQRLPDLRRAERLPWARPMLDTPDKPEVTDWDFKEGDGTVKTYVWLKDYDYLIILKKYPDGRRRLITAYWIEYRHMKSKLAKKYEQRIR